MWVALLLLSWTIEGGVGVWFCYHFWTFTTWHYGTLQIVGAGYGVLFTYRLLTSARPHAYPLTQEQIAWFFVALYVGFHILAFLRALCLPVGAWYRLGIRAAPSDREVRRFEEAYARLKCTYMATPGAPSLKRPWLWRVRDGRGMQMRFVGPVLVIDRGILMNRHFPALLAHELAHVNSFDLIARWIYGMFPPFRWSMLTLLGLPIASGPLLLYPLWKKYWRSRVFAADEYAAKLGQRYALIRALDDLRWVLDSAGDNATKGGRWLRETPYIESRIDRLDRYQEPTVEANPG